MSGLLRRLAQRTLTDAAPRVRPVAPIPRLAAPEIVESAGPATPAPDSPVPQTHTAGRPASVSERQGAASPGPHGATSPEPPAVPTAAAPAVAGDKTRPPSAPASRVEPRRPRAGARSAPAEPSDPAPTTATAPPAAPVAIATAQTHPVRAERLPTPLLPAPLEAPTAAAGARSGPHVVAVAAADSGPATEVHVHIAHVELTAVAESPTAPREPRATRTGPSLDEYLRKRGERLR